MVGWSRVQLLLRRTSVVGILWLLTPYKGEHGFAFFIASRKIDYV